jgi:hypothetical protein
MERFPTSKSALWSIRISSIARRWEGSLKNGSDSRAHVWKVDVGTGLMVVVASLTTFSWIYG